MNINSEISGVISESVVVIVVIGVGEWVCFSVVLVKVLVKGSNLIFVEIYVLLDSGLEVIFCYERLKEILGVSGMRLDFILVGMMGLIRVES